MKAFPEIVSSFLLYPSANEEEAKDKTDVKQMSMMMIITVIVMILILPEL